MIPAPTHPDPAPATLDDVADLLRQIVAGQRAEAAQLLNRKAAAAMCGMSVRRWEQVVGSGRAPRGCKIAKTRYWAREELQQWIRAGTPPVSEWAIRQSRKSDSEKFGKLKAG